MARYECPEHGVITYKETTAADVSPGRNCKECGREAAPAVGRP